MKTFLFLLSFVCFCEVQGQNVAKEVKSALKHKRFMEAYSRTYADDSLWFYSQIKERYVTNGKDTSYWVLTTPRLLIEHSFESHFEMTETTVVDTSIKEFGYWDTSTLIIPQQYDVVSGVLMERKATPVKTSFASQGGSNFTHSRKELPTLPDIKRRRSIIDSRTFYLYDREIKWYKAKGKLQKQKIVKNKKKKKVKVPVEYIPVEKVMWMGTFLYVFNGNQYGAWSFLINASSKRNAIAYARKRIKQVRNGVIVSYDIKLIDNVPISEAK